MELVILKMEVVFKDDLRTKDETSEHGFLKDESGLDPLCGISFLVSQN